jgi:hypothetical protein
MEYVLLILLFSALSLLTWAARPRRVAEHHSASHSAAVHQQHVYLYQGGHLSESEVESARVAIEKDLEADRKDVVIAAMRPGTEFAVQVRALAQIGTQHAIEILGDHLRRSIASNPQDQAWYWLDIARALRQLNWNDCLPRLFSCVDQAPAPLDQLLAAEAVCFPRFIHLLQCDDRTARRGAARLLHLALLGLRSGVQPPVIAFGRLGDAVATLWELRWEEVDPLAARVFHEALRLLQRAGHLERLLDNEMRRKFREQIQQLELLAEPLADWLQDARVLLPLRLGKASVEEQADLLHAAIDLRADTAAVVRPMLEGKQLQDPGLAIESLAFTKHYGAGDWLCNWVRERGTRSKWNVWRKDKDAKSVYMSVLHALRHFPCWDAEQVLVNATSSRDNRIQMAGLGSLGWWEPLNHGTVLRCLHEARYSRSMAVQTAAQAALARLGERQALQWFRRQLVAESSDRVHHVLDRIAQEGIVLLWPDLDHLADAEDGDIAHHACESLEMLREDFIFSALLR